MRRFIILFRRTIAELVFMTGIHRLIFSPSKPRYFILNYHGVVKNLRLDISKNHLSLSQFEEHLKYYSKHFDVLSLNEMISNFSKGLRPTKHTLAITFDDGYENNYTNAYPLLSKYNFPATIFITAQAITKPGSVLWYDILDLCRKDVSPEAAQKIMSSRSSIRDHSNKNSISFEKLKGFLKQFNEEKKNQLIDLLIPSEKREKRLKDSDPEYYTLLNESQIREMSNGELIEIGSHGLTHSNLDILHDEELKSELKDSKSSLERVMGKKITSIAFPDGAYNEKVIASCKSEKYDHLLAVNYRTENSNPINGIFPRHSISNTTTSASVIFSIYRSLREVGF